MYALEISKILLIFEEGNQGNLNALQLGTSRIWHRYSERLTECTLNHIPDFVPFLVRQYISVLQYVTALFSSPGKVLSALEKGPK